ncbi:LysR family transcriptional regulator [Saccharothrix sp. AJ9571]|nr:LysR family transcriptional regulator [Saccharothrix sp. AJ9571]
MDLDLGQVRAFVAVAEHRNFTRAAQSLFLTQQALSKRIGKLEESLPGALFRRTNRGVELTEAGSRFRPLARELVRLNDEAVTAATGAQPPLRVDVIDHRLSPLFVLRRCAMADPDLRVERSTRRGLVHSFDPLLAGELDLAFGWAGAPGQQLPAGLAQRLIRLEPLIALLPPEHHLAAGAAIRVEDLREEGVWLPSLAGPGEFREFLRACFGGWSVPIDDSGVSFDLRHTLEQTRFGKPRVTLAGADMELAADLNLRRLPFAPSPLYPWSVVWRRGGEPPALIRLIKLLSQLSRKEGWCACDPGRDWVPEGTVIPAAGR